MSNSSNHLTTTVAVPRAQHQASSKVTFLLAGAALACLGLVNQAVAQTSVVCDPAGDAIYGSGKGGPTVPAWMDIIQAAVNNAGDDILFTMTMNAPIPEAPAWENMAEGGQIWWGWRIVGDINELTRISSGCLLTKGKNLPAAYFLDLIWSVQDGSFRARLLDDTSCTDTTVSASFSPDRSQVSLLVPKALFNNTELVADPNTFQYFCQMLVWKSNSPTNNSFYVLDEAPDQTGGGFVVGTWSSSSNTSYGCP